MSFSSDVKEELVHLSGHENHCVVAELAAVISFSATVRCAGVRYYSGDGEHSGGEAVLYAS